MSETSEERILRVATQLFARHGFDGVSTREIAAAAGLNIATVHHHVGSKEELYRAVFKRAYEREGQVLFSTLEKLEGQLDGGPDAVRDAFKTLAVVYLRFLVSEPEVSYLWVRHGLDTGAKRDAIYDEYSRPLFRALEAQLNEAADRGDIPRFDYGMGMNAVLWIINGFVTTGVLSGEGGPAGPTHPPQDVAGVEKLLATVIDALLQEKPAPARAKPAKPRRAAPKPRRKARR